MIDDLYDLIGGRQTVWAATESFYRRVFADDTLRPFFLTTDMAQLCARQSMFISMLVGGRVVYTGKNIHAELDTPMLRKFRASWNDKNLAALKKLERLRAFFRFAHENGWLTENPAEKLSNPKVTMRPTMPFSQDEMIRILAQRPHGLTIASLTAEITRAGSAAWCYCSGTAVCGSAMP